MYVKFFRNCTQHVSFLTDHRPRDGNGRPVKDCYVPVSWTTLQHKNNWFSPNNNILHIHLIIVMFGEILAHKLTFNNRWNTDETREKYANY